MIGGGVWAKDTAPAASSPPPAPIMVQSVSDASTRTGSTGFSTPFTATQYFSHVTIAGNAGIVRIAHGNNVTWTGVDDAGNSYAPIAGAHTFDAINGRGITYLGCTNLLAGGRQVVVTPSGNPGNNVQVSLVEWAHVGSFGATAANSGNSTAPSITLSATSPDVVDVCAVSLGPSESNEQTFASSGTLLCADCFDGMAAQTGATAMTLANSDHWIAAGVVLHAANVGADGTGIRVRHRAEYNLPNSTAAGGTGADYPATLTYQFPCSGTSLAMIMGGGADAVPSATLTDNHSNTWQAPAITTKQDPVGTDHISVSSNVALSASMGSDLKVTVHNASTSADCTLVFWDVQGVTQLSSQQGFTGISGTSGPSTLNPGITINGGGAASGFAVIGIMWDQNTGGSLANALIVSNLRSGMSQSGPDPFYENNGWGHVVWTSTASFQVTFTGEFTQTFGDWAGVITSLLP